MILSTHGMVLFQLAANPQLTQRELSDALGITERRVSQIVKDLAAADMIRVERRGLRNHYELNPAAHFQHPTLAHIPLSRIITAVVPEMKSQSNERVLTTTARKPPLGAELAAVE